MSDARQQMAAEIQEAIQGQLRYILTDPGPWIRDVTSVAEDLAEKAVDRLCSPNKPHDLGGWLIQKSSYADPRIHRVAEFDMVDNGYMAYTEDEEPDDGEG